MLTGSKIKFVCFLAVYMLSSDFVPVSSLCISRAFAILMCSLSHTPIKMDQSGSWEVAGVTLDKMGAECQDNILPISFWFCCASPEGYFCECVRVERVHSCMLLACLILNSSSIQMRFFVFVFK